MASVGYGVTTKAQRYTFVHGIVWRHWPIVRANTLGLREIYDPIVVTEARIESGVLAMFGQTVNDVECNQISVCNNNY